METAKIRHKRITGSRAKIIMTGGPKVLDDLSELMHSDKVQPRFDPDHPGDMPAQLVRGHLMQPQAIAKFWEEHPEFDDIDTPEFIVPTSASLAWIVELTGLFVDDQKLLLDYIGVSPDGWMGPDDGVETKVPSDESVHLKYIKNRIVPTEHLPQCGISLLVTGAQRWWFGSYFPELEDEGKRYFEACLVREENEQYLIFMVGKILDFLRVHVAHGVFDTHPEESAEIVQGDDGFPVIVWGLEDAAIDILIADCDKINAPTNDTEYQIIKSTHNKMVKRRTAVNGAYKKATSKAKEYTDGAKQEEKRLIARMNPAEIRLRDFRVAWETKVEADKEAEKAVEAERVGTIESMILQFSQIVDQFATMKSDKIQEQISILKGITVDDAFQEFAEEAQQAKESALYRAGEILTDVLAAEAEAEQVAADKVVADKKATALKKRNDELEADQREHDLQVKEHSDEVVRVWGIKEKIALIDKTAASAMVGDLINAKKILAGLMSFNPEIRTTFEEFTEEAHAAIKVSVQAVQMTVDQKQAEADAAQKKSDDEAEEKRKTDQEAADLKLQENEQHTAEQDDLYQKDIPTLEGLATDIRSLKLSDAVRSERALECLLECYGYLEKAAARVEDLRGHG